ncbi:hypothetical protein O6R08_08785 [Cutibacterium equinum]|uniref:Scramblase n=1 Tax=Cutibacterium equinum TaxID=3016342 RepID=A0ABY7QX65_9ACTN|nr:hypothetical protein [Cutibacterium equinum]WCC79591.1 hypothetical protein O6R08_08785 [Cutibacterium equinum]
MNLLSYDQILMRQLKSIRTTEFTIETPDGQPVGRVVTLGSGVKHLFMGGRELDVCELDGTLVLKVVDPVNLGRDRMSIFGPDGSQIAELSQIYTLSKPKIEIQVVTGERLVLRGDGSKTEFTVEGEGGVLAFVKRGGSPKDLMMRRGNYAMTFAPGSSPMHRAVVIGAMIGFNLMNAKER